MTRRDALLTALRYAYRCAVTVAALVILYVVADVLRQGEPNPTAWVLLVIVGALAIAAAIAVWSQHNVAISVQVVAIPFLAALYLFEAGQTDPIDERRYVSQHWDLVKARTATGPISVQYSPTNYVRHPDDGFTLPSGERMFVVAPGAANVHTIMCREGARPFAEYDADELGFNNPRGILGKPVEPGVHRRLDDLWSMRRQSRPLHGSGPGEISGHLKSQRGRHRSAHRARDRARVRSPRAAEIRFLHVRRKQRSVFRRWPRHAGSGE